VTSSEPTLQPVNGGALAAALPRPLLDYDFQTVVAAPPRQRLVLRLMVALIIILGIVLAVAKVDITISADGKLVTSDSIIVVQPFETSIVRSIEVKVGQKVHEGDILATLDPTFARADESELSAKLSGLQALYNRLSAEIEDSVYTPTTPTPDELTQMDIWRKRRDEYAAHVNSADRKEQELNADIEAHEAEAEGLNEQIRLSTEAANIYETLVANALTSKLKVIETDEHLVDAKTRLANNLGDQQKLKQQVLATQADRDAFIAEWRRKTSEELAKARSDRDGAAAQLSKAQMRHQLAVLRAPRDGTVLEVADRPEGSVIREAEPLLRVVPSDARIEAEIRIDTRDVARLHIGDPVTVKFEALPWQQFGLAHGVLKSLTPDTLEDENPRETAEDMAASGLKPAARQSTIHYRAQVELTDLKLRNLPLDFTLRPGMRVLADIKLGNRSVLEYVLNPVTRVISDSMREP
jgi:hemolysin D